ncbi:MAG: HAD family phosphatase [Verrucomicrobiota bacterium]|nr:HAD family phosphatase [Verrucomicrobiota bacterium]
MTMRISRYTAVIFDMDGLMLDTERLGKRSMLAAANELGLVMPDDLYSRLIGRNSRDNRVELLEVYGQESTVSQLQAASRRYYEAEIQSGKLLKMRGLDALLHFLEKHGCPKAVATSTSNATARYKLEQTELLQRFASITTGDQILHGKPAPDIYLLAASRLGVDPKNCLALEDSPQGSRSAHAAGMDVCVIPDLIEPPEDVVQFARGIFDDLDKVREWLEEIEGK